MPRIPVIRNDIQATTRLRSPRASAQTFGRASGESPVGDALVAVGNDIGQIAAAARQQEEKRNGLRASIELARFKGEERLRLSEAQQSAEAGAPDFTTQFAESFDTRADEFLSGRIPDAKRDEARLELARFRNSVLGQATTFEAGSRARNLREDTQGTLDTLLNGVRTDPASFEDSLGDGLGIIDNLDLNGDIKAKLRRDFVEQATRTRFESQILGAQSEAAVKQVAQELVSDEAKAALNPGDFKTLQNAVRAQRAAIFRQNKARGQAAFAEIEPRLKQGKEVSPVEIDAALEIVKGSGDRDLINKAASLVARYRADRGGRRMPPDALRREVRTLSGKTNEVYKGFSRENAILANRAGLATGIGASYFANLMKREAAASELAGKAKGVSNPTSSATGLFQFVDETWLRLIKEAGPKRGIDIAGMTRSEILALRADPVISTEMAKEFTLRNRAALRSALGRNPDDAELYFAHFLGASGARRFILARMGDPDAIAKDFVSKGEAASNRNIFFNRDGTAKTVQEVYDSVERDFASIVPSQNFAVLQGAENALAEMEKALKPGGDIMSFADDADVIRTDDLTLSENPTSEDFARRGQIALDAQKFYGLATPRPLKQREVDEFTSAFEQGTVQQKLGILQLFSAMPDSAARGAFAQIGRENGRAGVIASLHRRNPVLAENAMRGQDRLKENKDVGTILKEPVGGTARVFNDFIGRTMNAAPPEQRQAMREVADAIFAERFGASGTGFDEGQYREILRKMVGDVGSVNGAPTLLPPNVTEDVMEDALDRLDDEDLQTFSVSGEPPVFIGRAGPVPVTADDIRNEGRLVAVQSGVYQVVMGDGLPVFDDARTGRQYQLRLGADAIERLSQRGRRDPRARSPAEAFQFLERRAAR